MIDHLTLTVRDIERSKAFYKQVLKPLGYGVSMEFEQYCGFGDQKPCFWMKPGDPPTQPSMHIAFMAKRRPDVDAFHAAALAAGARDNGAPGLRSQYHPNYYGAFVFDPDGHNIEAVCHRPAGAAKRPAKAAKGRKARAAARKRRPTKRR
jgi:catechol 2,3-dioxygenase-like lactoylglutathione lyase family enzyme